MTELQRSTPFEPSAFSRRVFMGSGAAVVAALFVPHLAPAADLAPARKLTRGAPQIFVDLDQLDAADNIHQLFHTAADCIPMTDDSVGGPVAWRERANLAELAGRPVKLRFHLKNARLYAYRIA